MRFCPCGAVFVFEGTSGAGFKGQQRFEGMRLKISSTLNTYRAHHTIFPHSTWFWRDCVLIEHLGVWRQVGRLGINGQVIELSSRRLSKYLPPMWVHLKEAPILAPNVSRENRKPHGPMQHV